MRPAVKQFLAGAFGLIALFLIVTHATGFGRAIGSGGHAVQGTFRVLQGRG